ncbi:hypothetical protein BJ085DRAFT_32280 [Dimargaris cristalligena]|uniref:Uncharacterized protein n=1 Tax=Dimargaris cristalligena TaxID=215637 RepID=A0A4P9ZKR0_9FUNG|nr:hypothetical protein BJ085DRAFT_32280 [Dimargaris cristalligena]|eukprot:RKP33854.1 hypothetical protein BJ085DRAFT_32280 [Dimargaris cristalligena]
MRSFGVVSDSAYPHVTWPQTLVTETNRTLDHYNPTTYSFQSATLERHDRMAKLEFNNVISAGKRGNWVYTPSAATHAAPSSASDRSSDPDFTGSVASHGGVPSQFDIGSRRRYTGDYRWEQNQSLDQNNPFSSLFHLNCIVPYQHPSSRPLPHLQQWCPKNQTDPLKFLSEIHASETDFPSILRDIDPVIQADLQETRDAAVWDYTQGLTSAVLFGPSSSSPDCENPISRPTRWIATAAGPRHTDIRLLPLDEYLGRPYPSPSPLFRTPKVPFTSTFKLAADWGHNAMSFATPIREIISLSTCRRRLGLHDPTQILPDYAAIRTAGHISVGHFDMCSGDSSSSQFKLSQSLALPCEPMGMAFNPHYGRELILTDRHRNLRLWDVNLAKPTWKGSLPDPEVHPDHYGHQWSACAFGHHPRVFWVTDQRTCHTIDTRAPERTGRTLIYRIPGYNWHPDRGLQASTGLAFIATHESIMAFDQRAPQHPTLWINHNQPGAAPRHLEAWRTTDIDFGWAYPPPTSPDTSGGQDSSSDSDSHSDSDTSIKQEFKTEYEEPHVEAASSSIFQRSRLDCHTHEGRLFACDPADGWIQSYSYHKMAITPCQPAADPEGSEAQKTFSSRTAPRFKGEEVQFKTEPESPLPQKTRPQPVITAATVGSYSLDEVLRGASLQPGATCGINRYPQPNLGRLQKPASTEDSKGVGMLRHYLASVLNKGPDAEPVDFKQYLNTGFSGFLPKSQRQYTHHNSNHRAARIQTKLELCVLTPSYYGPTASDGHQLTDEPPPVTLGPLGPTHLPWAVSDFMNAVTPYRHHPASEIGTYVGQIPSQPAQSNFHHPPGRRFPSLSGLVIDPQWNLNSGAAAPVRTLDARFHIYQVIPTGAIYHQVYGNARTSTFLHECYECYCHQPHPQAPECCATCQSATKNARELAEEYAQSPSTMMRELQPTDRDLASYNMRLNIPVNRRPAENAWLFTKGPATFTADCLPIESREEIMNYQRHSPRLNFFYSRIIEAIAKAGVGRPLRIDLGGSSSTGRLNYGYQISRDEDSEINDGDSGVDIRGALEPPSSPDGVDPKALVQAIQEIVYQYSYPVTLARVGQLLAKDYSIGDLLRHFPALDLKPLRVIISPWHVADGTLFYPSGDIRQCWHQIRSYIEASAQLADHVGRTGAILGIPDPQTYRPPTPAATPAAGSRPTNPVVNSLRNTGSSSRSRLGPKMTRSTFDFSFPQESATATSMLTDPSLDVRSSSIHNPFLDPSVSHPSTLGRLADPLIQRLFDSMATEIVGSIVSLISPAASADYLAHLEETAMAENETPGSSSSDYIDRVPPRECFVRPVEELRHIAPIASRRESRRFGTAQPRQSQPSLQDLLPPSRTGIVSELYCSYLAPHAIPLYRGTAVMFERWKTMWEMDVPLYYTRTHNRPYYCTSAAYLENDRPGGLPPVRHSERQVYHGYRELGFDTPMPRFLKGRLLSRVIRSGVDASLNPTGLTKFLTAPVTESYRLYPPLITARRAMVLTFRPAKTEELTPRLTMLLGLLTHAATQPEQQLGVPNQRQELPPLEPYGQPGRSQRRNPEAAYRGYGQTPGRSWYPPRIRFRSPATDGAWSTGLYCA